MPSSRPFDFTSSSASSRRFNRARPASDEEDQSDVDDYRRVKKASALLPSSKSSHKSSSGAIPSRSKRAPDKAVGDYDQVRPIKKKTNRDTTSDVEEEEQPASTLSEELLLERKAYDEWVDKKLNKLVSKREQMLEERVDSLRTERDEIQSQYDELRQLRNTAPEQALEEFKKAAEARYRHDKDLIASLKVKVEAAERRAKEPESGDRSMSILNASVRESLAPQPSDRLEEMEKQHKKELAEAQRVQKRLEEDVRNYKLQLEQEIAQSKALLAAASSSAPTSTAAKPAKSTTESTAASTSLAAMEDEKAVRKLYEDLTGLVVTGVERISPSKPYRRFKAIFAQEDYYSILMDLEESSSKVSGASGNGKEGTRDDIVYVPKIDEDRDSELLNSDMVPQEWLDALRFDRNMLFKWYEKTRKALLTDEARLKLRAREERNRH